MTWVRHGTTAANVVSMVVIPDRNVSTVEVINVDGAAALYFLVLAERHADDDPVIAGDDCEVIPAVKGALEVDAPSGPITVKLIADAAVAYSIRAD